MNVKEAIAAVSHRTNLNSNDMETVMHEIMTGQATQAQIGALLMGLHMKGETIDEITAAAKVMRALAMPVKTSRAHLIDTCGTGGDGKSTFNISTVCAFIVAAAGGHVAKHGNRSSSSRSGSADVLEAAGAKITLTAEQVSYCIEQIGVGFLFAPSHHAAMKYAVSARREVGIRTLFNLLGPLTNPANASHQLIGVFAKQWVVPIAEVLKQLGCERAMVVHADDGLDEISLSGRTSIAELNHGVINEYTIQATDYDIQTNTLDKLTVDTPQESLQIIEQILANRPGTALDITLLNAGAAIYTAGLADSLAQGINQAREVISSGAAQQTFKSFIALTNQLA